jgi:alpha-beta hydrolase superfamily lysophospholipase
VAARRRLPAIAIAVLLAGCAGERQATPIAAFSITAETLEGAGERLALSHWLAENPRAVILAVHGYGDYGPSTFGQAAAFWAANGVEVYAYDQRGFGRNASNRQWPGAEALIADLAAAEAAIRAKSPGLPLYIVGHSMGGGVALAAVGEGRAHPDGLALLAPAVWGGDQLNFLFRASAWTAALLAPEKRWTGRGVVTIIPTDNMEMLRELSRDPLHFASPSGREFMGLIRLMDRAVDAAPKAATPTLVVMGANDQVTPEATVRAAYAALPGEKRFDYVESGWHMLLRDLNAEVVWRIVLDWVLERSE